MTEVAELQKSEAQNEGRAPIHSVHHPAIKCFDAEETRGFYEKVLGLPLNAAVCINDDGLGGDFYFMHVFFRMADGDFLAFFDKDTDIRPDVFKDHQKEEFRLSLRVGSEAELEKLMGRLSDAGIEYQGPVETEFGKSIYCQDPNALDIELSAPADDLDERLAREKARAKDVLADWTKKTAGKRDAVKLARAEILAAGPPGPPDAG